MRVALDGALSKNTAKKPPGVGDSRRDVQKVKTPRKVVNPVLLAA